MQTLLPLAEALAVRLKARGDTVAVAESAAGGLVSAALLAQAGASAYFLGGAVVYTGAAKRALVGLSEADIAAHRSSTEGHALILAQRARERLGATWAVAESGAAGPSGNRYGDAAGHACLAVSGPVERVLTIETGHGDRVANMRAFAAAALALLDECLR
ncbi:MAG: CinA family protein [Acetobacteraceae bacterium]